MGCLSILFLSNSFYSSFLDFPIVYQLPEVCCLQEEVLLSGSYHLEMSSHYYSAENRIFYFLIGSCKHNQDIVLCVGIGFVFIGLYFGLCLLLSAEKLQEFITR